MAQRKTPPPPLDPHSLERLALRYVERFATTRGKLATYLTRKLRERGWSGEREATNEVAAVTERIAALGYVDDRAWGEAKAAAMGRRGLGARRVAQALGAAGITGGDAEALRRQAGEQAIESAVTFARRRRIGPFAAAAPADRAAIERQVAQMARAGHAPDLARRIARMTAEQAESLSHDEHDDGLEARLIRSLS